MLTATVLYAVIFAAIAAPYVANYFGARNERLAYSAVLTAARTNGAAAASRAKTLAAIASHPVASPEVLTRLASSKAQANRAARQRAALAAATRVGG